MGLLSSSKSSKTYTTLNNLSQPITAQNIAGPAAVASTLTNSTLANFYQLQDPATLKATERLAGNAAAISLQGIKSAERAIMQSGDFNTRVASETLRVSRDVNRDSLRYGEAITDDALRRMADNARSALGFGERALRSVDTASNDFIRYASNTNRDVIDLASDLSLKSLDRAERASEKANQFAQQATLDAMTFAERATRSEASLDTETLIKWGGGAVALMMIVMVINK